MRPVRRVVNWARRQRVGTRPKPLVSETLKGAYNARPDDWQTHRRNSARKVSAAGKTVVKIKHGVDFIFVVDDALDRVIVGLKL